MPPRIKSIAGTNKNPGTEKRNRSRRTIEKTTIWLPIKREAGEIPSSVERTKARASERLIERNLELPLTIDTGLSREA